MVELHARAMDEREAFLFRTLMSYQEMLQQAVHEVMRLEFAVEDLRAQVQQLQPEAPCKDVPQSHR